MMPTETPKIASPEILFDLPSTSSSDLSFSTPHTTATDLHQASKASTAGAGNVEGGLPSGLNGDSHEESADMSSSQELGGFQTVHLTPTSPSSETTHTKANNASVTSEAREERTPSPPIVLKSAPSTPPAGQAGLNDLVENNTLEPSAAALETNANASLSDPNRSTHDLTPTDDDLEDPRTLVIASLRTQISDLFSQVNLLNSKLVQSYDRVSTLEETLDENTERLRALEGERMNLEREKNVLELEHAKHDQMLRDGRLVESSAVAAELSRLMEESMASSAAKKTAEAKNKQMESELSDLSANLFNTANEMVATERQARASAEEALASTRVAVTALQRQLEAAKAGLSREESEKDGLREATKRKEVEAEELKAALRSVNDSNVVNATGGGGVLKMMNSHVPYKNEYLGFLAHLRGLVGTTQNAPAITSLLNLPFLARLALEDSEPTLRLDLAPSLNWLTRRSVLASIHTNSLLVEQIHIATLFLEGSFSSYSYVGFGAGTSLPTSPTQLTKVNCALCGKVVYMSPEAIQAEQNQHRSTVVTQSPTTLTSNPIQNAASVPSPQRARSGSGWAASKFLKSVTLPSLSGVAAGPGGSRPNSPTPRLSSDSATVNGSPVTPTTATMERLPSPPPATSLQTVIHAFRVPLSGRSANASTTNLLASTVDPSQVAENYGPPYPLCHTGWCLARLKTTCELWACVRTDVVERVWKEGLTEGLQPGSGSSAPLEGGARADGTPPVAGAGNDPGPTVESKSLPPVPPRRKMPNIWGMGRDVLDKAKAYSNSPAPDGAASTAPMSTTAGASSFFGGVRRTFSGSAALTSSISTTGSTGDQSSGGIAKGSGIMNDATASLPSSKRNTSHLSAVFTGTAGSTDGTAETEGLESVEDPKVDEPDPSAALSSPEQEIMASSSDATPAPSASLEGFVTPSEIPLQGLSLDVDKQATENSTSTTVLSSAITNHPVKPGEEEKVVALEEVEPPTPTPGSVGFGTSPPVLPGNPIITSTKPPLPPRADHARNTSVSSIKSEDRGTRTPRSSSPSKVPGSESKSPPRPATLRTGSRPGTPTKGVSATGSRPSTPNKGAAMSGPRPSTPSKLAAQSPPRPESSALKVGSAPPPVPRRAAARNAARAGVATGPKGEEKLEGSGLKGAEKEAEKVEEVAKEAEVKDAEEKGVPPVDVTEAGVGSEVMGGDVTVSMDADKPANQDDMPNNIEPEGPTLDVAPPTPISNKNEDTAQSEAVGTEISANDASTTFTPRSLSAPLSGFEPPSPTSRPAPPLSSPLEDHPSTHGSVTRPRRPSIVSSSSVYSPSVYTTNSGVNGPAVGGAGAESERCHHAKHRGEVVKFYVGRETWEERTWLKLVQIRESMFWARLGGVRY